MDRNRIEARIYKNGREASGTRRNWNIGQRTMSRPTGIIPNRERSRMIRSERKRLTDRLDKVCREVIRLRDYNSCQICHKSIRGSNSQPCHVIAKGGGASLRRWDLLNIFLGCMHCHQWWHNNPLDSAEWFRKRFPARESYLEIYRYGKPAKISTPEMKILYGVLKQKLEDLKSDSL